MQQKGETRSSKRCTSKGDGGSGCSDWPRRRGELPQKDTAQEREEYLLPYQELQQAPCIGKRAVGLRKRRGRPGSGGDNGHKAVAAVGERGRMAR